jgi:hypothetical protein
MGRRRIAGIAYIQTGTAKARRAAFLHMPIFIIWPDPVPIQTSAPA